MTDKQIIINGIDVSKGNFRLERDNQQKCECCHATGFGVICDCEQWHNCYFKQLARAKEEIEKLKAQIENEKQALQIDIDNLNQACLDLNQENDDLQNKLQAKEQLSVKQSHELIRLRKELQENKQKNVILLQENEELKNATVTLAEGLNFRQERADKLEQECEGLEFDYQKQLKNTNKWIVECENLQKQLESYKQTLDEIENYVRDNSDFDKSDKLTSNTGAYDILEIINKEKDK